MNVSRFLRTLIFPLGLFAVATGCAPKLVPFTHELRQEYNLTAEDLRNLQYWVSNDVTLQRYHTAGAAGVTPKHNFRVINESQVEEVKIKPKTPGVAEDVTENSLVISFEPGCQLEFGTVHNIGFYSLYARNWRDYTGEVDYCGREYDAVNNSNNAHLLIDYAVLSKFKRDTSVVKGRKL